MARLDLPRWDLPRWDLPRWHLPRWARVGTTCVLVALVASLARAQASVDLLHAVGTELSVSSAYRDRRSQVDRLVDGDPTTAWNSRTGDLVGASILVRLPEGASVTGIALIPGFARVDGETDLFTGNHRVARVRVLREGTEVGTFDVAHDRPELVTIPVRGAGGVWRIEIAATTPGTRSDWREVCISELQILGTAPGAAPGTRLPRTAVGALPDPPAATPPPDARALSRALSWLGSRWRDLSDDYFAFYESTGEPTPDAETRRELERRRAAILGRVAELTQPVDPARADAVRLAAASAYPSTPAWQWEPIVLADLSAMTAALEAVAGRIATDDARCRTARALAEMRLGRVARLAAARAMFDEVDESFRSSTGEPDPPGAARRSRALARDAEALVPLAEEWRRNARGVTTRLLRRSAPADERLAEDWAALTVQLEAARAACGWASD